MTLIVGPGAVIPLRALTRHAGIFGATGTGKTTTAAAIVERLPCPVILLDAKGDLETLGRLHVPRMSVADLGPAFMARALDLSDAQAGALQIAMAWADDNCRAVDTLQDLRDLLNDTIANADELSRDYGLISTISVAAVSRSLLRLERACPWLFDAGVTDWRQVVGINPISCRWIADLPGVYGAFAAHVLDSLYRGLGEIGDAGKPGLAVMIDESHLLFDGATPAIVRRIEQITRLIRSKGVALIYVTQSPSDLPDSILGQLGTRIQHGLNAATPRQVKALRAAAETMAVAPDAIQRLGIGQAFISVAGSAGRRVQVQPGKLQSGMVESFNPAPVVLYHAPRQAAQPPERAPDPVQWFDRLRRNPAVLLAILLAVIMIWQ